MAADSEGTGLASSLTDLMTSLAVIFILLLVALHNNDQVERSSEAEKTRSKILVALQTELKEFAAQGEGVEEGVEEKTDPHDPLNLLVVVPEGLLNFDCGKADLSRKGMDFLEKFTPKLAQAVCEKEDIREKISAIVVEGHADKSGTCEGDSRRLSPARSSTDARGVEVNNLHLSQARAMAVAREMLNMLSASPTASTYFPNFLLFLSASGRGSSEPITNPTTGEEERERSRRVVFKIRVRPPGEQQIQQEVKTP